MGRKERAGGEGVTDVDGRGSVQGKTSSGEGGGTGNGGRVIKEGVGLNERKHWGMGDGSQGSERNTPFQGSSRRNVNRAHDREGPPKTLPTFTCPRPDQQRISSVL